MNKIASAFINYKMDGSRKIELEARQGEIQPEAVEIVLSDAVREIAKSTSGNMMYVMASGQKYFDSDTSTDGKKVIAKKYQPGDAYGKPTGRIFTIATLK